MNIKPSDLVLEVGSGDKPYPRADILLDKLLEDSSQRDGGKSLLIDRPLVIGDVEALPFADKTFDYIIASHVLEHVQNPAKFLDELSRVGKRGYIETPLPERERFFDWPIHRWYVCREGKKLILVKKTKKSKKLKELYHFEEKDLPNLSFEWQGRIDYQIIPLEPTSFLKNLDRKLVALGKSGPCLKSVNPSIVKIQWLKNKLFPFKWKIKRMIESWERQNRADLFSLIVCPRCKGKLGKTEKVLTCLGCHKVYNLHRGKIPFLLP